MTAGRAASRDASLEILRIREVVGRPPAGTTPNSAPNLSKLGHLPRPQGLTGPIAVKAALPRGIDGIGGPPAVGLHGDAQRLGDGSRPPARHEGEARRLAGGLLEQIAVTGADPAHVLGAAALHESQEARVIDDAGEVGVLVIDPDRQHVPPAADLAAKLRPFLGRRGARDARLTLPRHPPLPPRTAGIVRDRARARQGRDAGTRARSTAGPAACVAKTRAGSGTAR